MKIYTIEHEEFNYDAYLGHVIVANSEDEVREIAKGAISGMINGAKDAMKKDS